jgi:ATP-binding cassette subfamily C (CFTR/MRP) protein 4
MSLMNEIEVTAGAVDVTGDIAYASQESWTFNASILQNILFGKPYDSRKFREVMSVCAMERDLKLFPFGEKTLVGERGVSLSGGQKARLTLARLVRPC